MNTDQAPNPAIIAPGQVQPLHAFGEQITFHLTGNDTGGKLTLFTELTPPGGGPPLHYHDHEDEVFMVLEGKASFYSEGSWHAASPGTVVFIPKGKVHAFKNVGDTPLKQMIQVLPSGFEVFMSRCAEEFAKPGGPDMAKVVAISAEHGIHFVQP